jgi:predicted dehydrogenase
MIRAALAGVSGYGRWHLLMAMEQALVGRLRLVGATIINQAEEAVVSARLRRQGVPVFEQFDAMLAALAGRVDLVLLPTGIQWHAPMTIAALQAGAHVLVEKPVAATLQEVDRIIATQRAAQRLVAVGFQDLYVPATHDIKRRVLAGEIGPLRRITVRAQWPRPASYYRRNAWAGRLRLDGAWVLDSPASNAFAHFLMLALFWAGETPAAAADVTVLDAELYRAHAIESFDTICFRAATAGAVELLFYGSHAGRENHAPEIRLTGDGGEITWVYERDYTVARRGAPEQKFPVPSQLDTRLTVLEHVIGRLRGEPGFVVEPALARVHTRLMNALHEFFPIHDVAPAHIETTAEEAGTFRRIAGLDADIARAIAGHGLWSEVNARWAVRGTSRALNGYDIFGPGQADDPLASDAHAPCRIDRFSSGL